MNRHMIWAEDENLTGWVALVARGAGCAAPGEHRRRASPSTAWRRRALTSTPAHGHARRGDTLMQIPLATFSLRSGEALVAPFSRNEPSPGRTRRAPIQPARPTACSLQAKTLRDVGAPGNGGLALFSSAIGVRMVASSDRHNHIPKRGAPCAPFPLKTHAKIRDPDLTQIRDPAQPITDSSST